MTKHFTKKSFTLLSLLVALTNSVIGTEVRISSVDEFIQFKDNVNGGTNYEGTTVLLGSDLDFSGKTFEPIGRSSKYFLGAFNGQGHVISNLAMTSSFPYTGLFGTSEGSTIRNVIIDSSCSIAYSYMYGDAHGGGIIGRCSARSGPCTIENSVNMASISFSGYTFNSVYLGGIAGHFYSYSYDITIKNCANYGDFTLSSDLRYYTYVGGVVGYSIGSLLEKRVYIYNSLDYGTVTHKGKTSYDLCIGGVTGYASYATTENCVSAGKIVFMETANNKYIGNTVGYIKTDVIINYCYATSELNSYSKYGYGTPSSESNVLSYGSATFELSEAASVGSYTGTSLIEALNAAADTNTDYSHWLLNKNNNTVTFAINGRAVLTSMKYQIMLLPSLASEGSVSFDGWYEDSTLETPLTSYEVTGDTSLYSLYGTSLTVTFDANGGESVSFASKKVVFNDIYGELPEATRTGYIAEWYTARTGGNKIESRSIVEINSDHTLYAQWTIVSEHILTFEVNGGTSVDSITQNNGTPIILPETTKTGYTFGGWFSDSELTTPFTETTMPAEDKTLYAKWTINQYTITFEANGGVEIDPITQDYGTPITIPESALAWYTFGGWFSDSELTTPFTATTMPAENITLYAKWTSGNQRTLSFEVNGGTSVDPITQDYGTPITLPETTKTGYTFGGWFTDAALTTPFTAATMPAENMILYAKWTASNQRTLSFEVNGGTSVDSITQDYGTPILLPETTKAGYKFGGWFTDAALTTPFTETTMPAESMTLYAKWTASKQYTITFDFGNGAVNSVELDFNATIEYPEPMTRNGFTFTGWEPRPETMPAENITVTAQWEITSPTEYVEVVFSQAGMTEDEAKKVIEELVPEGTEFEVTIKDTDSESTEVMVKFSNAETAKEFVEAVSASSDAEKNGIKAIGFSFDDFGSFAASLGLSVLAYFLAYLFAF